ncbi:38623_t:CDS:1, partial [Gigaspora margarita]
EENFNTTKRQYFVAMHNIKRQYLVKIDKLFKIASTSEDHSNAFEVLQEFKIKVMIRLKIGPKIN